MLERTDSMTATLNDVLREVHRLRKFLRDLQNEIDGLPRLKKAHEAKLARQEQNLKSAQDAIKHLKAANHEREVSLKSTHQQLQKYEKQMPDMKSPKEIEGKQTEIAAAKAGIAQLEEQILAGITDIEDASAKIPALEQAVKKAKADFAAFEADSKERHERLLREKQGAEKELKTTEVHLPPIIQTTYQRLVAAHGADALAVVTARICGHCLTSVTEQNLNELKQGRLLYCNTCGRVLYLPQGHD
jgi:uncharacterized protein